MNKRELKLVIYIRTSTKKQEKKCFISKIQKKEIDNKIIQLKKEYQQVKIIGLFKDIVSDQNIKNRCGLKKALKLCKKEQGYLIFQKLNILSSNIKDGIDIYNKLEKKMFIAQWKETNSFYFNIRLCIIQEERKLIRERTQKALNELRNQGVKLGRKWKRDKNGNVIKGQHKKVVENMLKIRQERSRKYYRKIIIIINNYLLQNHTYLQIANKLNELNFKTIKGNKFEIHTIQYLIKKHPG